MALSLTAAVRNAQMDAITTAVGASGFIDVYSGTPPANVGTALSGNTLLAHLPCSATFAPGASGGVLTLNAITNDSAADATGTATFARVTTSAGAAVVQGTVGTSGADFNFNTTAFVAGGPVAISSCVWTNGNS